MVKDEKLFDKLFDMEMDKKDYEDEQESKHQMLAERRWMICMKSKILNVLDDYMYGENGVSYNAELAKDAEIIESRVCFNRYDLWQLDTIEYKLCDEDEKRHRDDNLRDIAEWDAWNPGLDLDGKSPDELQQELEKTKSYLKDDKPCDEIEGLSYEQCVAGQDVYYFLIEKINALRERLNEEDGFYQLSRDDMTKTIRKRCNN